MRYDLPPTADEVRARLATWDGDDDALPPPAPARPAEAPPTLRSLVGSVPDLTGGVESVEYLRRKREASEPRPARRPLYERGPDGKDRCVLCDEMVCRGLGARTHGRMHVRRREAIVINADASGRGGDYILTDAEGRDAT